MRHLFTQSLLLTSLVILPNFASAKDNNQKAGDILELAIPLISFGSSLAFEKDYKGGIQFAKSFTAAALATIALKKIAHERRPNGECCDSFPSGHTTITFMSASFIQQRYGWKYAIPAYVAASYVGYTRVHSNQHYTRDVVAGAAVGILSSYLLTTHYKGINIIPYAYNGQYGVNFEMAL